MSMKLDTVLMAQQRKNFIHPQSEWAEHIPATRRVAWALMVYCVLEVLLFVLGLWWNKPINSLSVGAILAFGMGLLLLQKSLLAAVTLRWFSILLAVFGVTGLVLSWLSSPLDFVRMQWLYNGTEIQAELYRQLLLAGWMLWMARELSHPSVMNALARTRKRLLDLRIPVALGVSLAVISTMAPFLLINRSDREHAENLAREQLDASYQVRLSRLDHHRGDSATNTSALVWAWKEDVLKRVEVRWTKSQ